MRSVPTYADANAECFDDSIVICIIPPQTGNDRQEVIDAFPFPLSLIKLQANVLSLVQINLLTDTEEVAGVLESGTPKTSYNHDVCDLNICDVHVIKWSQ